MARFQLCPSSLARVSRRQLAICLASAFVLDSPQGFANTVIVSNCLDDGGGSLRQSIASANPGDTVSLTALPLMCNSQITLTSGAINILQNDLTIEGPAGRVAVAHGGAGHDRIFKHTGTGTLQLDNLNIALGNPYSAVANVYGGCVYSKGSVNLYHTGVYLCNADSKLNASGGGINAANLTISYSALKNNTAGAHATFSSGGGARVLGDGVLVAKYSTISGNTSTTGGGFGGGAMVYGSAVIAHSTISGNHAREGGALEIAKASGNLLTIADSTISGNSADYTVGGVFSTVWNVTVQNSTIAFNTASAGKGIGLDNYKAPGLLAIGAVTINLQSVLLSNNTYGAIENDLTAEAVTLSGANNFVRASFGSLPPSGLVFGQCPLLGPLRDNGGPTKTQALLSHSKAIDVGNNNTNIPLETHPYMQDQRGVTYPRESGLKADAGAYEVDQDDIVHNSGFEGC
jgi:hypothetical protein